MASPGAEGPRLTADHVITEDGLALPLRAWLPDEARWPTPTAVVLALHGFNDYSNAFDAPGQWLAGRGIATYAYDQRGFGAGPHAGLWAGSEALAADVTAAAALLGRRHPGVPLYLLGESMGGAVAILALSGPEPPDVQGAILAAPAVWSRETMPLYQRIALWIAARTIPWARFTGSGLGIQASDNIEMLRALGRDPLVIKETRVDAMDGLTDLMSAALEAAPRLRARALLLYGDKDEVVPRGPSFRFWRELPAGAPQRKGLYAEGWHMLLRDLQAEVVLQDIAAWIETGAGPLPSGADRHAEAALSEDGAEPEIASETPTPAVPAGAALPAQSRSGS
ncbi:MAG: alpha/beta hydrolase [Kiloniellales bacterium]